MVTFLVLLQPSEGVIFVQRGPFHHPLKAFFLEDFLSNLQNRLCTWGVLSNVWSRQKIYGEGAWLKVWGGNVQLRLCFPVSGPPQCEVKEDGEKHLQMDFPPFRTKSGSRAGQGESQTVWSFVWDWGHSTRQGKFLAMNGTRTEDQEAIRREWQVPPSWGTSTIRLEAGF